MKARIELSANVATLDREDDSLSPEEISENAVGLWRALMSIEEGSDEEEDEAAFVGAAYLK